MSIVPRDAVLDALEFDLGSAANNNQLGLCCFVWTYFVHLYYCVVRNSTIERVNKFCVTRGKTPIETREMLRRAYVLFIQMLLVFVL